MAKNNNIGKIESDSKNQEIFRLVEDILSKENIPSYYYSFCELYDDSYCIIMNGTNWELIYYERGQKGIIFSDLSLELVCMELIKKLVPKDKKTVLVDVFLERCQKYGNPSINNYNIFTTENKNCNENITSKIPTSVNENAEKNKYTINVTSQKRRVKPEIVAKMAKEAGITQAEAKIDLNTITRTVAKKRKKNKKVQMAGFGSFEKKSMNSVAKKLKTGATHIKPATTAVPTFTPGKALKDYLSKKQS